MKLEEQIKGLLFIFGICILLVSGFMMCSGGRDSGEMSLVAMTYNIRYASWADWQHSWESRKDMVASTIRFHEADIIGMQEAFPRQVKDLEGMLPDHDWFGVGREDGRNLGEFNPIFFRKNRFEIIEQDTFWLSETPEIPGIKGWDANNTRIVTWGKFMDWSTGEELFVFNTHFDHIGDQARLKSAELLLARIEDIVHGVPLIVTGDFNCTKDDPPYQVLVSGHGQASGIFDAKPLSLSGHYGSTRTFNGYSDDSSPGNPIDYIFVRNIVKVLRHGVIAEKWDGRFSSDHYPVLAEIGYK